VLVAQNAPFDLSFLKHYSKVHDFPWPAFAVLDTAIIARKVLTRDEVPNCKLGTLAAFFGTQTTPNHRALDDARATVDVLHGLIERLGSFDIYTLEELHNFGKKVKKPKSGK
jgi:DNA polymerase III subunit epsilon